MGVTTARLGVCVATFLFAACNFATGADDLRLGGSDDNRHEGIDTVPPGEGSGSSGDPSGSGSGPSGSGPGGGAVLAPADGVTVTAVEVYQGVRRPLMANGAPTSSTVPIVAGRDAVFRIYYEAHQGVAGAAVIGQVNIGDQVIEVDATVSGSSLVNNIGSTINVPVDGSLMTASTYSVGVMQFPENTSGDNTAAMYPTTGQDSLPLGSSGQTLEVVLVPIQYGGDGSNRLPDTSPEQVERYRKTFWQMYPIPEVKITVHPPMQWNSGISPNGSGWNNLLDAMISYRSQQNAPSNHHYYGIFAAAQSMQDWCWQGCVSGLSLLAQNPNDALARTGIGVGFSGDGSTETAAHEVGHQQGRGHAPCGASQGIDPSYPNNNGSIGDWGLSLTDMTLVSASTADFMSYCEPTWISPHNFTAIFNRLAAVNGAQQVAYPAALVGQTWDRVRIDADGSAHWSQPLTLDVPPSGELTTVTVQTATGTQELTGHYYAYDHLEGGVLLFPQTPQVTMISAEIAGFTHVLDG